MTLYNRTRGVLQTVAALLWLTGWAFCVGAACPAPNDPSYIAVHGWETATYGNDIAVPGAYDTIKKAGFKWVRVLALWPNVERSGPTPDWTFPDQIVTDASSHGFSILLLAQNVPQWAHCAPVGPNCTYAAGCPTADCTPTSCTSSGLTVAPHNFCYFYNFMKAAVTHYGTQVAAFELWNEPNLPEFWTSGVTEYQSKILNPGIHAVQDARAAGGFSPAYVVAPSTYSDKSSGAIDIDQWVSGYTAGIDVFSIHAYGSETTQITAQSNANAWCQGHINCLQFWVTEGGFSTDDCSQNSCVTYPGPALLDVQRNCANIQWCFKDFIFYLHDLGGSDWGLVTNSDLVRTRLCHLEAHYGSPLVVASPCAADGSCPNPGCSGTP